jgi:hypothetical protein
MDAGQAYVDAADRLDAANEDFDAALAAGDPNIVAECGTERDAARRALHRAAKAAGC